MTQVIFQMTQCMMLQNHEGLNDPVKMQNRQVGFNVTEYKKVNDMVSDSTIQPTFKKPPLAKEEYPQLSEKTVKISLSLPITYLC